MFEKCFAFRIRIRLESKSSRATRLRQTAAKRISQNLSLQHLAQSAKAKLDMAKALLQARGIDFEGNPRHLGVDRFADRKRRGKGTATRKARFDKGKARIKNLLFFKMLKMFL